MVDEFNKNVYDIIIASDDGEVLGDEDAEPEGQDAAGVNGEGRRENREPAKKKQRRERIKRDREYGVSRGIDFKNVACVLNFDLPTSARSYTHRIGRTARAGQSGMAFSFVVPRDRWRKHPPTSIPSAEFDEKVLARIEKRQRQQQEKQAEQNGDEEGEEKKPQQVLRPYDFDMAQVDSFRYRMEGALRAVTRTAVREARTQELKRELVRSERLRRHFEENPDELRRLVRHDADTHSVKTQHHLRHVPDYLLPADGKAALAGKQDVGFLPKNTKRKGHRRVGRKGSGRGKIGLGKTKGRRIDPLRSFTVRGKRK